MDRMTSYHQLLEVLHLRAREQQDALTVLREVLIREAAHVRRQDQARYLRDLKAQVMQKVQQARWTETYEGHNSPKPSLVGELAKLVLTVGATVASKPNPLSEWMIQLASYKPQRATPYGTVWVMLRPDDPNSEVSVVSVSRMARESGRSEAQIQAILEARGYLLMAPESFSKAMDGLQDMILKGTITLPMVVAAAGHAYNQARASSECPFLALALRHLSRGKAK